MANSTPPRKTTAANRQKPDRQLGHRPRERCQTRTAPTAEHPTTLTLSSERPKISQAKRRPTFIGEQLEETIIAVSAIDRSGSTPTAPLRRQRGP